MDEEKDDMKLNICFIDDIIVSETVDLLTYISYKYNMWMSGEDKKRMEKKRDELQKFLTGDLI